MIEIVEYIISPSFSFQFSKPARNLSFEVESRRSAGRLEEGGEDTTAASSSSFYSTASSSSPAIASSASSASSSADFSPLDHIRDRILGGVGHGRRGAAGGKRRREDDMTASDS